MVLSAPTVQEKLRFLILLQVYISRTTEQFALLDLILLEIIKKQGDKLVCSHKAQLFILNFQQEKTLRFHAALYLPKMQKNIEKRMDEILALVDLSERADEPVKNYSGGMSRRLGIGRALLNDPQILLLDEPTLGVDVQSTHRIYEYIRNLKDNNKTIIVATNIMAEADALCDEVIIIDRGKKYVKVLPLNLNPNWGREPFILFLNHVSISQKKLSKKKLETSKMIMEKSSSMRRKVNRI